MPNETRIRLRCKQGSASYWTAVDPILLLAEIGYENDTLRFKFGDGVTAWTALPYNLSTDYTINVEVGSIAIVGGTNNFLRAEITSLTSIGK